MEKTFIKKFDGSGLFFSKFHAPFLLGQFGNKEENSAEPKPISIYVFNVRYSDKPMVELLGTRLIKWEKDQMPASVRYLSQKVGLERK